MVNNTTRVDDLDQDDVDLRADTEPATSHDVGEGAALGAIGGVVVGALAGGPVGAIVGAIAGGAASAAGVSAVDKHDHDYARTSAKEEGYDDTIAADPLVAPGSVDPLYPTGVVAASTYGASPLPVGVVGSGAYDAYADDYRGHFQSLPNAAGYEYGDYEPAYRYGYDLANDPRYQDVEWDALENNARSDWETRREGTWDRFKDHVRYAWDRVRGRAGTRRAYNDLDAQEVDDYTNRPVFVR